MPLDLLPSRSDSAATNMATDFLALQHYPNSSHARFRSYGWQQTACTFGFGQKIAWVRQQLSLDPPREICRRPTGGGIVDHRNDWTYSLVIPRGHDLYDARAVASYEAIHRELAASLQDAGCEAVVKVTCEPAASCGSETPAVCFDRAELFDVVHAESGLKIAGAAQKRTKRGLLLQGSLWRSAVGDINWDGFEQSFISRIAARLREVAIDAPWPETWDESIDLLADSYASSEWIERR